jgi:hypothetical protein
MIPAKTLPILQPIDTNRIKTLWTNARTGEIQAHDRTKNKIKGPDDITTIIRNQKHTLDDARAADDAMQHLKTLRLSPIQPFTSGTGHGLKRFSPKATTRKDIKMAVLSSTATFQEMHVTYDVKKLIALEAMHPELKNVIPRKCFQMELRSRPNEAVTLVFHTFASEETYKTLLGELGGR